MNNSIPLDESKDFPEKDHWGHAWKSPSMEFGLTMSCPPEVGWLLYGLVRATKPSFCVETGTHKGLSSMFIASALRDNNNGHLVTIDIEDYGQEKTIRIRGIEPKWISCILSDSIEYEPHESIDFLFLDAAHGYDPVKSELEHFQPYLSQGAIVCIDDCRLVKEQRTAVNDFIAKAMADFNVFSPAFQLLTSRGMIIMKYGLGHEDHDEKDVEKYRKMKNFCKRSR